MATLNELIYDIKNIAYGGTTSDDAKINDRQIQYWIKQGRALLIKQELHRRFRVSDSYVQHINCLELEQVDIAECCTETSGCTVLKSKKELPVTIQRNGKNTILSVESVDGQVSFSETSYYRSKWNSFNKYTGAVERWYLKNNYLYIINSDIIDKVSISGIFEDPDKLADFISCSGESCFDPATSDFPITAALSSVLTNMILKEKMGIARQMPNDLTNNQQGDEQQLATRQQKQAQ